MGTDEGAVDIHVSILRVFLFDKLHMPQTEGLFSLVSFTS